MKLFIIGFTLITILQIDLFAQPFKASPLITREGDNYDFSVLTQGDISFSGDTYICWINNIESNYTVFFKRISPTQDDAIVISSDSSIKSNPQVAYDMQNRGINIAWQQYSGNVWQIRKKDLVNGVLSNDTLLVDSLQNNPQITMSDCRIGWIDNGKIKIKAFKDISETTVVDSINCSSIELFKRDVYDRYGAYYAKLLYEKKVGDTTNIYIAKQQTINVSNTEIAPDWEVDLLSHESNNINPKFGVYYEISYQSMLNGFWSIRYEKNEQYYEYFPLDTIQAVGCDLNNPVVFTYPIPTCIDCNNYSPYFVAFEKDSSAMEGTNIFINTFSYHIEDSLIQISHIEGKNYQPDIAFVEDGDTIKVAIIWINENNNKKNIWIAKSLFGGECLDMDIKENKTIPGLFRLYQNYPNPFNPVTNIQFNLPADTYVEIQIFNIKGEKVKTLTKGHFSKGLYKIEFDASSYASGVYFYKLKTENFQQVRKMLLVK